MPTLLFLGDYNLQVVEQFSAVQRPFVAGHFGDDAPAYAKTWRLTFRALPNATAQNILDPEDITTKPLAKYVTDFIRRRWLDGASFQMTDATAGVTVTGKVKQDQFGLRNTSPYLYESSDGLLIESYA